MRQRSSLAVIAALLGAFALWRLFPQSDVAASFGQFRITRQEAIARARVVARANGFDASRWTASAQASDWRGSEWIYLWRRLHPSSPVFASLVNPFVARVTLRQPDGERFITVTLTPAGRLIGYDTAERVASHVGHSPGSDTLDAQAEGVAAEYLGNRARLFRPVNRGVVQSDRLLYSWEYSDPTDSPHLLRFEASFSEQQLVHAELIAEPADSFRAEIRKMQSAQGYLVAGAVVSIFAAITLAFPAFFRAFVRQRLSRRRLATVGLIALALVSLTLAGGPWLDRARADAARDFGSILDSFAGQFVPLLFIGFAMVLFYGAGRGLLQPLHLNRWCTLEAFLDLRLTQRPVGAALFHGVLCGVALAALPYLIAPIFSPALTAGATVTSLFWSPIGSSLVPMALSDFACIVLLVLPLMRWIRPRWLGLLVYAAALTVVWFVIRSPFDGWTAATLCAGWLFAIGLWMVESEYGALAALVAGAAMAGVWAASTYWVQPIAALSQQGWWAAAPFVAMALGGAFLMRFGVEVDTEAAVAAMRAESAVEVQSQRDRLASDFDVARRAQQAMLPQVPSQIGEASLAASCIPARDVGGDLYDFYATGDGRYAIGVADVSGKGVPASLYMTLTKGFLAAAGRDSDDLLATLSQLNSHLYAAGKRKIFVTMALVFFSPVERRVELARAGHNPPLWRRASRGRSEYLTPPGMGLGLTSRLLFERALRLQQIELEPGDAFVLYSDGITEAMNEAREQFGEDRLQTVVDACDGCDAHATEQAILQAVRAFIGLAPPHDDMTLFVVRV